MLEAQGREPGDVCGPDLVSLGAELVDRRIHVDRVPEHDEVDHEPKRTELVLLALAVALAELAPLAMEDDAGELERRPIRLDHRRRIQPQRGSCGTRLA